MSDLAEPRDVPLGMTHLYSRPLVDSVTVSREPASRLVDLTLTADQLRVAEISITAASAVVLAHALLDAAAEQ